MELAALIRLGDDIARVVSREMATAGIAVANMRDHLTGALESIDRSRGSADVTVTLPPLTGRVYTSLVARIMPDREGGK